MDELFQVTAITISLRNYIFYRYSDGTMVALSSNQAGAFTCVPSPIITGTRR
jgi:hypothetical protein